MPKKPAKPKESLADWVSRTTPGLADNVRPLPSDHGTRWRNQPKLPTDQTVKHPKYVPLVVWAQLMFGEYSPHINTLRSWVHDGRIQPQPKKMGRHWFVKVDAEYVPD
jgi:hypothetical protein